MEFVKKNVEKGRTAHFFKLLFLTTLQKFKLAPKMCWWYRKDLCVVHLTSPCTVTDSIVLSY